MRGGVFAVLREANFPKRRAADCGSARDRASWGPGKYDAQLFVDGKALGPDGSGPAGAAALIPPAFGLAGVNLATSTGFGSATYWNAFVANMEMHGQGTFVDARLANASQFPVAARAGFANVRSATDLITAKLPALQLYQLAIPAPTPPAGSFDADAVVDHYDAGQNLGLAAAQKSDIVEYLKSL